MTLERYPIYPGDARSFDVASEFTPDPTSATPQFALSVVGVETPGSWVAGAWKTAWSSTTGRIVATSPTIGAAASLETTAGTEYWLWQKVTVGSETFVDLCLIAEAKS